ncbi:MAG: hypothetical protein U0263_01070 [Polyangiaceae bacterium]
MRVRAWLLAAASLAGACHEYRTDPRGASSGPTLPAQPPPPRGPLPEWVPALAPLHSLRVFPPFAGQSDGGTLSFGRRLTSGGPARQNAKPALISGARIPTAFGGGFFFWSAQALYSARTFAADLEPVVGLDTPIDRASFGPGYALLFGSDGSRFAVSLPGKKVTAIPTVGLIDVGMAPDGRGVMLSEPDRVWTLAEGGKAWRDVSQTAQGVAELVTAPHDLWLRRTTGEALRVEKDGSLSEHRSLPETLTRPPKPVEDPRWPASLQDAPLTRAVQRGIPLDEHTALVEVAGALARVDLASGTLKQMGPALLASASNCELLPVEEDVLLVCLTRAGGAVVLSQVGSSSPKVEHVFGRAGAFFAGSLGTLAFAGPCEEHDVSSSAVVCVRQRDGSWRELGDGGRAQDPKASDAGAPRPQRSVQRWIPTRGGGAIGLVVSESGGLLDAASGAFTPFSSDHFRRESGLVATSSREVITDNFAATDDGRVIGYSGTTSIALAADGRVERSPQQFQTLESSGALALAIDSEQRVWQSSDFGRTWAEVARPPGTDPRTSLRIERCSRVGCQVGEFYRLGYRKGLPSMPSPIEVDVPPRPPRTELPRLTCERVEPPRTQWATRTRSADGTFTESFDFGAKKLSVRDGDLAQITLWPEAGGDDYVLGATLFERVLSSSGDPAASRLLGKLRTFRFFEPFGPPKLVESRFTWTELLTRAAQAGSPEANEGPSEDQRGAVPVLPEKGLEGAGLLVPDPRGVVGWIRPGVPMRIFALGRENLGMSPVSALLRGKDELIVLAQESDCQSRVISVTAAGARTLFDLPRRPTRTGCTRERDALGVSSSGELGVLRRPGRGPPTRDDPALFFVPGKPSVALAPWSGVSACGSDAQGIRSLVGSPEPWLELATPGLTSQGPTLAVVRWSAEQVCTEAVLVGAPVAETPEVSISTAVVARFSTNPSADRRGFALGAEHVESLRCTVGR